MKIVFFLLITFFNTFLVFSQSTIGSEPFPKPPKGSSEIYSTTFATLIAVGVVHPGTNFVVYAQNEPSLGQQEVFWLVRVHAYNFQSIKFKKTIHLICGKTIEKYAEIFDVKAGTVYKGTTFSGDPELSDLIFSEDCNLKTNRIQSVTISDVTGAMYPDDPANPEFQAKQIAIKNELLRKKQVAQQKALDSLQTIQNNAAVMQRNRELLKQQQTQQAIVTQNQINQQTRINNTNRITQNLVNQQQYNSQLGTTLTTGINTIAQLLIEKNQTNTARERAKQDEVHNQNQQIENVRYQNTQTNLSIAGTYYDSELIKPTKADNKLESIYYIAWYRVYNSALVYLFTPIELNKYPDNTWPLFSDVEKKIVAALVNNGAPNGANPIIYGYFSNIESGYSAFYTLKKNIEDTGVINAIHAISLDAINQKTNSKATGSFWDN